MSHFTVTVICDKPSDINQLLAPYQENNMGDCPEEYMTFNNSEETSKKEWETEGSDAWYPKFRHQLQNIDVEKEIQKIKNDKKYSFILTDRMVTRNLSAGLKIEISGHVNNDDKSNRENYRNVYGIITSYKKLPLEEVKKELGFSELKRMRKNSDDKKELIEKLNNLDFYEVNVDLIDNPEKIPYKEKYPIFKEFIEEYQGSEIDPKTGKYGYWENPNAKWDWYTVGGRWMGAFLVKDDEEGNLGSPGTFNNNVPNTPKGYKWVDACQVSNIDWDKMKQIKKYELLKNEAEDGDIWEILISDNHPKRNNYTWYKPEYFLERFKTKENYIKSRISFSTYSVISPDGKWHSAGDMGWWGFSSETHKEEEEFENSFYKKFIEPNQDKFITMIDCHI